MLTKPYGSAAEVTDGVALFATNHGHQLDKAIQAVENALGHPILPQPTRVIGTVDQHNTIEIADKHAVEAFRVTGIANTKFSTTAFSHHSHDSGLTIGLPGRRRERYVYVYINRGVASSEAPRIRKLIEDELCRI